jgi:type IV fimbrial biogenesis protein FimT
VSGDDDRQHRQSHAIDVLVTVEKTMKIDHRKRARGFTLIELLAVLAVAGIMATIALPNLTDVLTTQRLRASGTDLMSSLLLARSEAIKRNANVQIAPSTGTDWTTGWIVTVVADASKLDAKDALGDRVRVTGGPATFTYQGNGRLTVVGVTRITMSDAEQRATARCLVVDPSGLPTLSIGKANGC